MSKINCVMIMATAEVFPEVGWAFYGPAHFSPESRVERSGKETTMSTTAHAHTQT